MPSRSRYGINDALDLVTITTSDHEHNYQVIKTPRPCMFINPNIGTAPYNHDGNVVYEYLASKESS